MPGEGSDNEAGGSHPQTSIAPESLQKGRSRPGEISGRLAYRSSLSEFPVASGCGKSLSLVSLANLGGGFLDRSLMSHKVDGLGGLNGGRFKKSPVNCQRQAGHSLGANSGRRGLPRHITSPAKSLPLMSGFELSSARGCYGRIKSPS